jgi:hypothetical protein
MTNYASEIKTKIRDSLCYHGVAGTIRAALRSALRPILAIGDL